MTSNCSCLAYAYETGIGCMSWARNLIDTQKFSRAGVDLYVRVASSELGELFLFPVKNVFNLSTSGYFFFQLQPKNKTRLVVCFV
jgi:hypothetical protein